MKSTNSLYQTEAGKNLRNALNGNYWDARETIHNMIDAIKEAIPAAATAADKAELEATLQSLQVAYDKIASVNDLLEDTII